METVPIPESLAWWRSEPGGVEWLERLPGLIRECAERWSLVLAEPYESHTSWVAPAVRADGSYAVLKLNYPDADTEHEAMALSGWNGVGAVHLLEHD